MKTKEELEEEDRLYYHNHPFYNDYCEIRNRDAETLRRKGEKDGKRRD